VSATYKLFDIYLVSHHRRQDGLGLVTAHFVVVDSIVLSVSNGTPVVEVRLIDE
jgi:hypothetical protein